MKKLLVLTETQLDDLLILIQRTNLNGAEVPAYLSVLNALQEAKNNNGVQIPDGSLPVTEGEDDASGQQ